MDYNAEAIHETVKCVLKTDTLDSTWRRFSFNRTTAKGWVGIKRFCIIVNRTEDRVTHVPTVTNWEH